MQVCMSYATHFRLSSWIALQLFLGSFRALAHAVFPEVCATSTTRLVSRLQTVLRTSGC